MPPMTPARHASHSLNDVARRLAPHLRIISASRPTPVLRNHNVLAVTESAAAGRHAVLALEAIEVDDDKLGTVVMGAASSTATDTPPVSEPERLDPEGVTRVVLPRILAGGVLGAIAGALLVGGGAFAFGAREWNLAGAAAGGAMLCAVFGAIWLAFAGLGGTDAYRQTFVDEAVTELTIVSVHTDDPEEASAALARLDGNQDVRIIEVNRFGEVSSAMRH
jgi:hypothetical protein